MIFLADKIFITIPAGSEGVLWKRLDQGTVMTRTYPEGFHMIAPWNNMTIYNLRLDEATTTIKVLADDGLEMEIEFLVRYRPRQETLPHLHKFMGEDYLEVLILPEVNSRARVVLAQYSPEEIYSQKRDAIQREILAAVKRELSVYFTQNGESTLMVFVEDVLIKRIHLPDTVRKAIETKVENKHKMLQYKYILAREMQESRRKMIEALGIAKFQDIVREGISERYLRWKGIDATLELAKSNNSKVVVIGAGKEGMPLILGNMGEVPAKQSNEPDEKVTVHDPKAEGDKYSLPRGVKDNGLSEEMGKFMEDLEKRAQEDEKELKAAEKSFSQKALDFLTFEDLNDTKPVAGKQTKNHE